MAARSLSVIQPVAVPQGTPEFEAKRASLLQKFADRVPPEYLLPQDIIENPPIDVSGILTTCGILTLEEIEITEMYLGDRNPMWKAP